MAINMKQEIMDKNNLSLLQDDFLIDCYFEAIQLNLDPQFIAILDQEIKHRNLPEEKRIRL